MQAATKRGRGRPRKDAIHQSQDSQPGSVDRLLDMLDEPEADVEVQAAPKAKAKGRPRKEKAEPPPEQVPKVPEAKPQAKRERNSKGSAEGSPSQASLKRSKVEEKSEVPLSPGEEFEWAEDPADERLTVAGAKYDAQSRLMLALYNDLKGCFAGEPKPEKHPSLSRPGLRRSELPGGSAEVCLDGLKSWRDAAGEGWIASRKLGKKNESRWFSARTWGSWRLAFFLARLQQQLWKQASSGESAPIASAADPPAAEASEPKLKVLSGKDEWLAFSPKEVDLTLCLARTWKDGHGGQCQEPRCQGADLCPKHRTQAVSTRGLSYGFVDGPIPAAKLTEFQHAALRIAAGLSVPKKQQQPQASQKNNASSGSKGEGSKKEKTVKHKLKVRLKQPKPKLKSVAPSISDPPSGQTPEAAPSTREPQSMDAGQTRRRRNPIHGSRQRLHEMRDSERRKWSGVDSAMDAALAEQEQHELDFEPASICDMVRDTMDEQGHVNENNMGRAVKIMDSLGNSDARLGLAAVLRRSVRADQIRAAAFVTSGGVGALRPWLQAALPQNDERLRAGTVEEQRKREQVVLECLALLSALPVTYDVLQKTGIGRTLTALRGYCAPAMEPAGRLIAQWQHAIRSEARPNQQGASKELVQKTPAASMASSQPAAAAMPAQTAEVQTPIRTEPSAHTVSPPVVAALPLRPEVTAPPTGSDVKAPAPAEPSIFHRGRRNAHRQRVARGPQNAVEATLRKLFILGEVLERGVHTGTSDATQAISSSSTAASSSSAAIDLSEAEDID
eukprot:TRINITY_DN23578_c0_g1_i1.p1 TRINITY_DN23578_c0_g1~~TRINITY_DN23578_c0_g1_i1.p1  ORF type:complete len:786 (-),score=171.54 TRINITY_DN23578_c0_g1_i1:74-2431(-)